MKTILSVTLLIFLCKISYSQNKENFVENKYKHIKSILDDQKVNAIALTQTISSIADIEPYSSIGTDSTVHSKDGTYYYRKLYYSNGRTRITEYRDGVLTVNGIISTELPFFIKNVNLFYSVFHIDDYDSCTLSKEGNYDCRKNGRSYKLFFDENEDLVKTIGTHQNEFSEFDEIYGLRYPTKIKQFIKDDFFTINSIIKINSLTVLKEGDN